MIDFAKAAQTAIYQKLNGAISCPVYDAIPHLPATQPDSDFPYVVLGNDTLRPWDSDSRLGAEVTITLHIWSRAQGFAQAKAIAAEIYALLHRKPPAAASVTVVDSLWEFEDFQRDEDGKTRHGVVRYRLTMQET